MIRVKTNEQTNEVRITDPEWGVTLLYNHLEDITIITPAGTVFIHVQGNETTLKAENQVDYQWNTDGTFDLYLQRITKP